MSQLLFMIAKMILDVIRTETPTSQQARLWIRFWLSNIG